MATPRKLLATAIEVIKHSDSLVSYRFETQRHIPKFRPGQFLHLALDPYDPSMPWPDSRVFSIASSPLQIDCVDIVISVKGAFTQRMYDEINKGDQLWLKLPYGDFTFDSINKPIVLVAGGTGISPFISFLRNELQLNSKEKDIHLYYGIRNEGYFLFRKTIVECLQTLNGFRGTLYSEEPMTEEHRLGMLNIREIRSETVQYAPVYFLSGPLPMINSFRDQLRNFGVLEDDIRIDAWE